MHVEEEQEDGDWAENKLGIVEPGGKRLTSRLVKLARSLARAPDMPLPQAPPQWHDLKAAYRFFDNAKALPEHILASHIDAAWSRSRTVPIVLAVQDTTYLNWAHHPATQGLGRLSDVGRGVICHSTLAVTPERLPLGLLAQCNWVRDDDTLGTLPSHKKRAIDDREADVYELFAMKRSAGVELLVRASWNRVVDSKHRYLWEKIQASPVLGTVEVNVPRHSGEPVRRCTLALRSMQLTLKPPQARIQKKNWCEPIAPSCYTGTSLEFFWELFH